MRANIHNGIKVPENSRQIVRARMQGYKAGGAVEGDEAAKDVHKHESHLHKGEPKTRLKRGGSVKGKKPAARLDKPKRAGGGEVYKDDPESDVLHPKETTTDVDSEGPPKRARGGRAKHKKGNTNIIIHTGGGQDQQALAQAKQQGEMSGAMKAASLMKAKMGGAGGPPGAPPMGPPPGPGGGGMPGPAMAPGMPPMGRKAGGRIPEGHVEVKKHTRRKAGGRVGC